MVWVGENPCSLFQRAAAHRVTEQMTLRSLHWRPDDWPPSWRRGPPPPQLSSVDWASACSPLSPPPLLWYNCVPQNPYDET